LAWWQPDAQDKNQPAVPYNAFKELESLALVTNQAKATPWIFGRNDNELVFTTTGTYLIKMSENLETDDGTPVYQCEVFFEKE
jgi:hypothetical protein